MLTDYLYAGAVAAYAYLLFVGIRLMRERGYPLYLWGFNIFVAGLLLWTATLYVYFYVDVGSSLLAWGRVNYAAGYPMFWGLATFLYAFPSRTPHVPEWIRRSSIPLAVILSILTLSTPLIDAAETMTADGPVITFGAWYALFPIFLAVHLAGGLACGVAKLHTLRGLERLRFQYIFPVFVVAALTLVVVNAVLPAFGIFLYQPFSFLIMLPVAVTALYAMYWHRLFNPSFLFLRGVRFAIMSSLIIAPTAGMAMLSQVAYPTETMLPGLLLGSVIGISLFHAGQKFLPKFIGSSFAEMRRRCAILQVAVHSCASLSELQFLLEKTFIVKLGISSASVSVTSKTHLPRIVGKPLAQQLGQSDIAVRDEFAITPGHEHLAAAMDRIDARLGLLLYYEGACVGIVLLGQKTSDTPYVKEEIDALLQLRPSLEVSLTNILLKERFLKEKNLLKTIIHEKTSALRQKNRTMRELVKQQADFITIASHELRTPLTVARIQADALSRMHHPDPATTARAASVRIALEKLNHLIQALFDSQLFDLNKVQLAPEPIPLASYLQEVCTDYRPMLRANGLDIVCQIDAPKGSTLWGDPHLLRQVLQNLCSNARDFAPRGTSITLAATYTPEETIIRIIDHGPGVCDESKAAIFEKFHRSTQQTKGIGLGLYLSAQIIRLHGGRLWVEDTPGGGATFCCALPAAPEIAQKDKGSETKVERMTTASGAN